MFAILHSTLGVMEEATKESRRVYADNLVVNGKAETKEEIGVMLRS